MSELEHWRLEVTKDQIRECLPVNIFHDCNQQSQWPTKEFGKTNAIPSCCYCEAIIPQPIVDAILLVT